MLLTLFYMVSTWVQSWRLSSLKTRLIAAINYGPDFAKPSIMFYIKPPETLTNDAVPCKQTNDDNGILEDLLTSHLCRNKNAAKLKDLIWSQGDKRLCTIYPEQEIDVSDWLAYPFGKMHFPLSMDNCNQIRLSEDSIINVLIEANFEHFNPSAFAKAVKLEDYGFILSWMTDKLFAAIMKTDVDHLSKLSIALMQGQCFVNNGLVLTRIESVEIKGIPCRYTLNNTIDLRGKRLIGKAQWDAHMKTLQVFSNAAKEAIRDDKIIEVDGFPGINVTPGKLAIGMPMLDVTEQNVIDEETQVDNFPVPSTPPPTPASAGLVDNPASELANNAVSLAAASPTFNNESIVTHTANNSTSISSPIIENKVESNIDNNPKIEKNVESSSEKIPINRASKFSPGKNPCDDYVASSVRPPNVLIYADSTVARDNIERALKQTLNKEKYTIYTLSTEDTKRDIWKDQTNLMVVCGNVDNEIASQLVDYIVKGGKLLALCSDALHTILPSFKTAEVREHELVRFSYGRWKNVRMMHHIFCYQASPVKSRFSQDNEDGKVTARPTPTTANVKDKQGKTHIFHIKVLGAEETWNTPSIVLAGLSSSGGQAIFSQIHLEADPSQYELEERKFNALKESNSARLEILSDLLSSHLKLDVKPEPLADIVYNPGFFLGRHELKLEMLERLKDKMQQNNVYETAKIKIQFCGNAVQLIPASQSFLPVLLHQCPDNFSTVEYFENLHTKEIGRLVIYSDIMTSTMDPVAGCQLHHGLAVIARQQTQGYGRNKNMWLSPIGCVTLTLQLHIPINTYLGQRISIIQHLVPVAVISAIKTIPDYENIDLRVKWPNDIYIGNKLKLGGLIVTSVVESKTVICNIGLGVNLCNSLPTSCINDIIMMYNEKNGTRLKPIGYERFFALIFNAFESIFNEMQNENLNYFYQLYYDYWLHTDAEITVVTADGTSKEVKILGIDSYGFLEVQGKDGKVFTVQPDGNSFDILKGLIAPSFTR